MGEDYSLFRCMMIYIVESFSSSPPAQPQDVIAGLHQSYNDVVHQSVDNTGGVMKLLGPRSWLEVRLALLSIISASCKRWSNIASHGKIRAGSFRNRLAESGL